MLKRLLVFITFALCFSVFATSPKCDGEDCLAVVGFFDNAQIIKNITAYLYEGSVKIDSVVVTSTKDFGFVLKRNKNYSVQIVKEGFYQRMITIKTDLPADINATPLFVFEFEITLIPKKKGVDDFFMDFPIALIAYDAKAEKFMFSRKYTTQMQKELKKVETQFKVRKSN